MARLARVVIPGLLHHVTQRSNGRSRVFFSDADYALYRALHAGPGDAETIAPKDAKVEKLYAVIVRFDRSSQGGLSR
jgi:hypothetical protein